MAHIKKVQIGENSYLIEPTLYITPSLNNGVYSSSLTDFTLDTGVAIQVKFATTNPAEAQLKINNDAKYIYYNNDKVPANLLKSNHTYTLVYQASLNNNAGGWELVGDINTWRSIGTGANDTAAGNHGHGNITNDGKVGSGNTLLKTVNGEIQTGPAIGTDTTKFLNNKGEWAVPAYIPNTDENVKQTPTTTNATYELLFSESADNDQKTEGARKTSTLKYNPSTKTLTIDEGTITGTEYSGNAATATKFNSNRKIELTGAVTGSATTDGNNGWTISTNVNHDHTYIGKTGFIVYPTDGYKEYNGSSKTGYIKIKIPQTKSSTMFSFDVDIFNYVENRTTRYHIAGYNYNNASWNGCTAYCTAPITNLKANLTVRFWSNDNDEMYVSIGEVDTSWSYPKIVVHNIVIAHSGNTLDNWKSGWTITVENTAFDNALIKKTITNTNIAYKTVAVNLTTTANAIAYYTDAVGTFGTLASANGTLYATEANGTLNWGILPAAQGGTGFNTYTIGDILCSSETNTLSKLSGNTTTTRKFLRSVATTADTATAPAWDTVTKTDVGLSNVTNDKQLPIAGGTMTGVLTLKANQYTDTYAGALNANNSNIYGVNSIYTADPSNDASEGIHFRRDDTHTDTLWMSGGALLFVPNRQINNTAGQVSKANSQKVARFTTNPTASEVVITSDTDGGIVSQSLSAFTTSLGLSNALHFIGITSTALSDGDTTATLTAKSTGSLSKTTNFVDGDVVMDEDQLREYVWSGDAWRLLGITTSTSYSQSASGNSWITSITQSTDGTISATTGSLDTSGTWDGTAEYANKLSSAPTLAQTGTSSINLAANKVYTLTVGGQSIAFKTPSDANTNTLLRTYTGSANNEYPLLAQNSSANATSAWTEYTSGYKDYTGVIPNSSTTRATINLSTGHITVPGGISGDLTGNADTATAANITTTTNAVAYYTNTSATFSGIASANGTLYATEDNGTLNWGILPIAQGGTGATDASNARTNLGLGTIAVKTDTDYVPYAGNLRTALGSSSPQAATKTWWESTTNVPRLSIVAAYNNYGNEYSFLFSKGDADKTYGTVLRWGYQDRYMYLLRKNSASSWISSDWEKIYAGYADTAGSATNDSDGNAINTTYVKKVTSTDNAIVRFDGDEGAVQNSTATINDKGTMTINGRLILNPKKDDSAQSYNEGIRINVSTNGWANIQFGGADESTSGTADGQWLIGRRGSAGSKIGAVGDFSIEEQDSTGAGLTIHKDTGGMTLYANKAKTTTCFTIKNVNAVAAAGYARAIDAFTPSMKATSNNIILIGKSTTAKESAYIGYHYESTLDNSCLILGLSNCDQLVKLFPTGQLSITTNLTSSSTSTGSLVVAGGAGIAGTLYVGTGANITGITAIDNTTAASTTKGSSQLQVMNTTSASGNVVALELYRGATTSTTNGWASWQLAVDAGIFYIRSDWGDNDGTDSQNTTYSHDIMSMNYKTGVVNITATADSSSSSTGALILDGGLGVAKKLYVGTQAVIAKIKIGNGTTDAQKRTITVSDTNLIIDTPSSYGVIFQQATVNKIRLVADTFYPETTENGSIGTSSNKWSNMYAVTFNGDLSGTASNVTTTADTSNAIYLVGVKSGATTALLHDTKITAKGSVLTIDTLTITGGATNASMASSGTLTIGNKTKALTLSTTTAALTMSTTTGALTIQTNSSTNSTGNMVIQTAGTKGTITLESKGASVLIKSKTSTEIDATTSLSLTSTTSTSLAATTTMSITSTTSTSISATTTMSITGTWGTTITSGTGYATVFKINTTEYGRFNTGGMFQLNDTGTQNTHNLYVNGDSAFNGKIAIGEQVNNVIDEKVYMAWNATDQSLDFIFA